MNVPFLNLQLQYRDLIPEIERSVHDILEKCCFIGGKYVSDFEDEVGKYIGVRHAVGCGNGTDALALALKACNIKPGDEVITSPFTFFATAEAIASVGAIPVFTDIREDD